MSVATVMVPTVKRVVKVRVLATESEAAALRATLHACNAAASWLSAMTHAEHVQGKHDAQKRFYTALRERFGLSAQPTIRVISKVADAYTTLRANIAAGNCCPPGSARRTWVAARPVGFRADAAQPFDVRCLSWQFPDAVGGREATISIWTMRGRLRHIRVLAAANDLVLLRTRKIGETDLIYRDGKWFLHATIEVPDAQLAEPVNGFLGVDMGIVNIATTSTGQRASGARLNRYRKRQARLRKRLQAKKTSSARRLLKKRRRKETRFAADLNHQISKCIVAEAERTGYGIAVEKLTGIRDRVRLRKPNGPRCTRGRSPNSARFWPTRPSRPVWRSSKSTPPTPRRHALPAAGSTNATAAPKRCSNVAGVASLGTPTTTQRSTSPHAVSNAGAKSCVHAQRPPWQPVRAAAASLSATPNPRDKPHARSFRTSS